MVACSWYMVCGRCFWCLVLCVVLGIGCWLLVVGVGVGLSNAIGFGICSLYLVVGIWYSGNWGWVFGVGIGLVIGIRMWSWPLVLGFGFCISVCIGSLYWPLIFGIGLGLAINIGFCIQYVVLVFFALVCGMWYVVCGM